MASVKSTLKTGKRSDPVGPGSVRGLGKTPAGPSTEPRGKTAAGAAGAEHGPCPLHKALHVCLGPRVSLLFSFPKTLEIAPKSV